MENRELLSVSDVNTAKLVGQLSPRDKDAAYFSRKGKE